MRLDLLSHSGDALQVCVFEVCRIFQPIAEQAVERDMAGPDDGDGEQERPVRSVSSHEQGEREEERVSEVVERRADARVREVAKHGKIRREKEHGEEQPTEVDRKSTRLNS